MRPFLWLLKKRKNLGLEKLVEMSFSLTALSFRAVILYFPFLILFYIPIFITYFLSSYFPLTSYRDGEDKPIKPTPKGGALESKNQSHKKTQ